MPDHAEIEEARLLEQLKAICVEQQLGHECIDSEELAEQLINLLHEDVAALVDKLDLEKTYPDPKP